MISGIGIDVIEVKRVSDVIERHGERFLKRLFTPLEVEYCSSRKKSVLHYAGRFAAKEAAFKAFGRGWGGDVSWKDIEIRNEPTGAPQIVFYGKALLLFQEKKITRAFVSITHIQEIAAAIVILED